MDKLRIAFYVFVLIVGYSGLSFAAEITVAVAANVQYVFQEIKLLFQKESGIRVKEIIGASGKLTAQIENGAPFDIFLSADTDCPEALYKKGLTLNRPRIYVYGTLVLWTMNNLDLSRGIFVINDPSVKKIAIASPDTAPYGRESIYAAKQARLYDQIENKLVYGESIAQVNQFIASGAADIGFTAKSVVLDPNMRDQGKWIEVDRDLYEPIAQGAVILKNVKQENREAAQKFFDFLFSPNVKRIYENYGYKIP